MEQAMKTAANVAVTSKSTRETSRELTENELAHVSGGTTETVLNGTGQYATAFRASRRL